MLVFYTNRFIPGRFAGVCVGPLILIRPEYRGDKGLLAHEKEHRRQWLSTFGIHSVLYAISKKYRLKSEAKAYARQVEASSIKNLNTFASYIVAKYSLGISLEDAIFAIKYELRS